MSASLEDATTGTVTTRELADRIAARAWWARFREKEKAGAGTRAPLKGREATMAIDLRDRSGP